MSRWVSEPLVDGTQIDQITDPVDQAEVLLHLLSQTPDTKGATHDQVDVVWKLGEDLALADTLRQIDSTGGLSQTTIVPRTPGWEILPEPSLCGSLLYYRYHSVASNYARPSFGVGRFGIIDNSNDGFPHGFEVQIVGPSSARQVMVHLTLVSTNNKGHKAWYGMQTISDTRDL